MPHYQLSCGTQRTPPFPRSNRQPPRLRWRQRPLRAAPFDPWQRTPGDPAETGPNLRHSRPWAWNPGPLLMEARMWILGSSPRRTER